MAAAIGFISDIVKHANEIKKAFKQGSDKPDADPVRSTLDNWKDANLNIGVTGRSGVGKSTFINTIRGLTAEHRDAAATGVVETTREAEAYPHPDNKNLVFWDLPGMGTSNFPRETYFKDERVQFNRYDMFLILSSGRFFEDDLLLAATSQKMGKLFIFIRTHVDRDLENESTAKPLQFRNPHAAEELIGRIRDALMKSLKVNSMFTEDSLFLIDGQDLSWNTFDFGKLINRLIGGFAGLKREAFILTLNVLHANVLEQKVPILRDRIWKVSLMSAAGAAFPIPGLSICVDTAIILEESLFFMKQLGLSKENIKELKTKLDLQTDVLSLTLKGIPAVITALGISEAAENISKFVIPIIGCAIAAVTSFSFTYAILNKTLNMMVSDSRKMHTYFLERAQSV